MSLAFKVFALSDLGLVREGNEDSGLVSSNLVAVADGMGGHAGGEVASTIAITALTAREINEDSLLTITKEIDLAILDRSNSQPELAGMGTTLTALHLTGDAVGLLHVGDTRCYAFAGGKLNQLSNDHTVMQELIDQGRITPDEAVNHPQRSLLTHALMGDSGLDPILISFEIKKGDRYLLCSDGLTNVLSDYEISKIIEANEDKAIPQSLITEVRSKGAPDNITIIWSLVSAEKQSDVVKKLGAANE